MHFVYTENEEQKKQLQFEFSMRNSYFMIPSQQSYVLTELLTSISYEFFHNKVPLFVDKIKEMISNAINNTYSLVNYRQLMKLIKNELDRMQLYKEYLLEMNKAFAQDNADLDLPISKEEQEANDVLFIEALKGQTHRFQNLQQFQLPMLNLARLEEEAKTDKTIESDLHWKTRALKDSRTITGMGTAKLQNFFTAAQNDFSFENWKTDRKEETKEDTSLELSSFRKKQERILQKNKNLSEIIVTQEVYDMNRQIYLGSPTNSRISHESQHQKVNIQKKMRHTLMNLKLRPRRK